MKNILEAKLPSPLLLFGTQMLAKQHLLTDHNLLAESRRYVSVRTTLSVNRSETTLTKVAAITKAAHQGWSNNGCIIHMLSHDCRQLHSENVASSCDRNPRYCSIVEDF